jgi:hypothetical protein
VEYVCKDSLTVDVLLNIYLPVGLEIETSLIFWGIITEFSPKNVILTPDFLVLIKI